MHTLFASQPKSTRTSPAWLGPVKLGLEISEHEARMVVSRQRSGSCELFRAGKWALSSSLIEAPSEAAAEIAAWLRREAGAQPGQIVATLPAALFEYESVSVSAEEIAGPRADLTARQLITELLGDEVEQVSYDYWLNVSPLGNKLHLAWAPLGVLVQVAEGLSRSGWRIAAFDLPVVALARLGQFTADLESPSVESQLIVELNQREANYVWSVNGEPHYLRTRIVLGNQSAAQVVATRRRVSLATAETSLARWGLERGPLPAMAEMHESCLSDWLERLGYEIHRTIQFIQTGVPSAAPPGVVLCGDGAEINGLAGWLSQHLSIAVSVAGLPRAVQWKSAEPYRAAYAVALANSQHGGTS